VAVLVQLGAFLGLLALLHRLYPDYDPCSRFLSEYVLGPYGGLMVAAMLLGGTASVVLAVGLARSVGGSGWLRLAVACLLLTGAGYYGVALFPTDDPHPAAGAAVGRTVAGVLHEACSWVCALLATTACLVLPLAFARCTCWRSFTWPALAGGVVVAAAFLSAQLLPRELLGLAQRVWILSAVGWSVCVAWRVWTVEAARTDCTSLAARPCPP
jgi:hypothetical protein